MANSENKLNSTCVQELREVSKQHDVNLVYEFGSDRIVTWLQYFIFALGALMKITEFFGELYSLACRVQVKVNQTVLLNVHYLCYKLITV